MSQWGQGAPGYQYPLQTGFPQQQQQQPQQFQQQNPTGFSPGGFQQQQPNPGFGQPQQQQFFGGGGGGLQPQPTGFVPQRPLQGQPTGFIPQQQTGFIGSSFQSRPPPPPVPPLPQFQQQQPPPPPPPIPQPSFLNQPPGGRFGGIGGGLTPQQTGYPGGQLVPQVTGFIDPRLQMLSSSFLPASSTPGGAPQLQPLGGGPSLQQSFRQHNEEVKGTAAPRVPWALSKGEKKSYDQIFRAWDASGSGFIDGQKAIQVFGQSGLSKDDLAKVWALADADNRGKLNVAEFHVAMGLIYRKLNGNEIPDVLPPELVPPSHRDLDEAVHFVRDLVKNDVRASSPSGTPASLLKVRSFTDREAAGAGSRQDATVYKHDESAAPLGGRYVPRSRHVDRDEVRGNREVRDATSDLDDLKRQLEGTASRLDAAADEREGRTREDDALDAELDDLRFRAKRLREDLDYLTRAPKTSANDEERRKLERQLLTLMHERLPDVERRVKDRQARREREKRERDRDRDRRNERFGRFGERDDDPYERRKWEREREERERDRDLDRRPYSRGGYDDDRDRDRRDDRDRPYSRAGDRDRPYSRTGDRDRPYSRGTYDDDRDRRDDRDRDRDRRDDRTPSAPPPPPPPAPSSTLSPTSSTLSPTSAGRSAVSPSPAPNLSSMTPAERAAYLKEQAAKKVRERMAALGVTPSPSSTPRVDTTVEDRLAQERKEAEDKTREAERAAEERERARRERLENEKALREGRAPAPAPSAPTLSKPTPPAPRPPPPAVPAGKKAPAPPPPRGVLKNAPKPPAPAPPRASPAPPPPPPPAAPAVDPEEEALKQREAELKARREARRKQIEMEEEEERKADEARAEARRMREAERARAEEDARKRDEERARMRMEEEAKRKADEDARKKAEEDARKVAEEERARAAASAASPPPAPAPPPPPPAPPAPSGSSTNPFHRANGGAASAAPAVASPALNGGNNPFFRSQPSPAPPSAVSAPKGSYNTASRADADSEDDWGAEKDIDEDSSDDEVNVSRNARQNIAAQLFGSILPARPQSAGPPGAGGSGGGTPTSALSPPPPPPSAPPAPVPPAAPPAPPPPSAISPSGPSAAAPPTAPGDRGALLSAIQGGARLRKAKTNDRSGSGLSGRVLGDTAPPPHINTQPIEREPPPTAAAIEVPPPPPPATNYSLPPVESPSEGLPPSFSMEAVDSKASNRQSVDWYAGLAADHGAVSREPSGLAPPTEEDEAEVPTPSIEVHASEPDLFEDIDKGVSKRVRTLYAYEGQRPEDLSFGENIVLVANPSKSGGEWWYGTAVRDGKAGFFPKLYVQEIDIVKAKAFYPYSGGSSDELPFAEGDVLDIVDRSESDWWKAEHAGAVFIVPAAYLEIIQGDDAAVLSVDVRAAETADDAGMEANDDDDEMTPTPDTATSISVPESGPTAPDADSTHESEASDSDADSDSDYVSFSDSDADEDSSPPTAEERAAREAEHRMVLEAAGLVLKQEEGRRPPPRPVRRRPAVLVTDSPPKKRRAAPAVPKPRRRPTLDVDKSVPDAPPPIKLDDAYERYEAFKLQAADNNSRFSVVSIDSAGSENPPSSPVLLSSSHSSSVNPPSSPVHASSAFNSVISRVSSRTGGAELGGASALLSHLLGRSKTPISEGESRPKLVISGPISGPVPVGEDGRRSPSVAPTMETESSSGSASGFGLSWSSLVNKSALEGLPERERKRQEAIFEFIATENAYVRDLQLIVEVFYSTVIDMLEPKAVAVIFANVEDLLIINTTFLSLLEERQRDCRLYIDRIGDVLDESMRNMKAYREYCVNQANAAKFLQTLREAKPELAAHLQKLREGPSARNLDLSSYLLVPMQRITRYPLLIKQILHYSEPDKDSSRIESALRTAEKILGHINEEIRVQENRERLKELSQDLWIGNGRLDLSAPTRNLGERKLIKEGVLTKTRSGRRLRTVLCNDILILTDEQAKTLYRVPINLTEVRVQLKDRDDLTLEISITYPRRGDSVALRAASAREAQSWVTAIQDAARVCREAHQLEATRRLKTQKSWQPAPAPASSLTAFPGH